MDDNKKRLTFIILLLLILPYSVNALLGDYKEGERVNFEVQFRNINGTVETSAANSRYEIFYPNNSRVGGFSLLEVYSSSGLFLGNYTIPSNMPLGVYTIRYNSTTGGIPNSANTLYFRVINDSSPNRIYFILFLIAFVLFFIGILTEDKIFPILSGMLLVIISVYAARIGFYGIQNTFLTDSFVIIIAALGGYLIVRNGYDIATEGW
jgi:hypothetical protein